MGFNFPSICVLVSLVVLVCAIGDVQGDYEGRCPYPCCQDRPYEPVCASNGKTFANICFLELYNRNHYREFVGFRHDGPCYDMGHPDYNNQFYPEQQEHYGLYDSPYMEEESYNANNYNHGYGGNSPPPYGLQNYTAQNSSNVTYPHSTYYQIPPPGNNMTSNTSQSGYPGYGSYNYQNNATNNSTNNSSQPTYSSSYGPSSMYPSGNNYNLYPPVYPTEPPMNITTPPPITTPSPPGQVANVTNGTTTAIGPNERLIITSPNFIDGRANYPPNSEEEYMILGTEGCVPTISCDTFQLVQTTGCFSDFLSISDGIGAMQRFCGTAGPQNVGTGWTIMLIRFQAGSSGDVGFNCSITCSSPNNPANNISNALSNPATLIGCTCGIPGNETQAATSQINGRIVGGVDAPPNFWTWMVAIFASGGTAPMCGGSLITDRHILTAAHCFVNRNDSGTTVVLNDFDTSNSTSTVTITRTVMNVTCHPLFNPVNFDYDVCVLEILPINLLGTDPILTTVCIPPRGTRTNFDGVTGTVLGWGTTSENGTQPNILQMANIPVIPNDRCDPGLPGVRSVTPRQICAGFPNGAVDACDGDSGGPFMVGGSNVSSTTSSNASFTEIGVVSFGHGCAKANSPGVYAALIDLGDWVFMTAFDGIWCQNPPSS